MSISPPNRSPRDALFLALVVANLLPIFWFSRLPSADGPAHVYHASLFLRLADAADPAWQFVQFNRAIPPSLLAHVLLALLTWLTSPIIAERLLIAAYAVGLPLALRYALRAVARDTHGFEFVGLFLVFNQHLHWGFYNFLTGLVAYLVTLGVWVRVREQRFSAQPAAALALLVTAIYFCHPVPLFAFWSTVAFLLVIDTARSRTLRTAELQLAVAAVAPSLLLYLHYAATSLPGPYWPLAWSTPRFAASVLVRLYPLATYTTVERSTALALSFGLFSAAVWAFGSRVSRSSRPTYALTALLFASLVFLAPSQAAGGSLITPRLVYFPLFFVLLWFVSMPWPARAAGVVVSGAVILTLTSQVSRWPVYERYDARLNAFLEMARTRAASPVEMFYVAGHGTAVNLDAGMTPYLPSSVWGYVAVDRGNVLLDYLPALGYYPFAYRANTDPARFVVGTPEGCYLSSGGLIDEQEYRRATGLFVGSQIVWLDADRPDEAACLRAYGKEPTTRRAASLGTLIWFDHEGPKAEKPGPSSLLPR